MKFERKLIAPIVFAAIVAVLVAYAITMIAAFPRWLVDDAFILFRYAENLVETGELNWNPGENATEGYTGVTLVLLIAAAMKFGVSPMVAAHVIGIAAFFCCAVMIVLILRGFNLGSVTALALFCTAPFMYAHAWSGLETTLFCAAILFALYTFTHSRQKLFVAALLVLSLTRPEGALMSLLLLAVYRPISLRLILWYIIPGAIYFIWRFAYYGQLLPNTFYAKAATAGMQKENLAMIRKFAATFLAMPALLALIYVRRETVKKHKLLIIGVLLFSLAVLFTYISSELVMTFSYRFLVPFYTIIVVAIGAIMARPPLSIRSAVIVLLVLTLWFQKNTRGQRIQRYKDYCLTHYTMLQDEHIAVGKLINRALPPDECIIVNSDAGAIPFYAKRKAIDFGGLNDEYLAHEDSLTAAIIDYFYSHNAGAVVLTSRDKAGMVNGKQIKQIQHDNRFNRYSLIKKYDSRARRDYFEFLYVRKDLVDLFTADEIAEPSRPEHGKRNSSRIYNNQRPISSVPVQSIAKNTNRTGVTALRPDQQSPEEIWTQAQTETDANSRMRMYRKIVSQFPDSEHVPEALFMIGFIYSEELGKQDLAIDTFEELIDRFPDHTFAESAKSMLAIMQTPPSLDE